MKTGIVNKGNVADPFCFSVCLKMRQFRVSRPGRSLKRIARLRAEKYASLNARHLPALFLSAFFHLHRAATLILQKKKTRAQQKMNPSMGGNEARLRPLQSKRMVTGVSLLLTSLLLFYLGSLPATRRLKPGQMSVHDEGRRRHGTSQEDAMAMDIDVMMAMLNGRKREEDFAKAQPWLLDTFRKGSDLPVERVKVLCVNERMIPRVCDHSGEREKGEVFFSSMGWKVRASCRVFALFVI